MKSAFQDIVSDELKKIKNSSSDEFCKTSSPAAEADDMLWEYDGLHSAYQGDCEEILLEMQRIFYEDLCAGPTREGEILSLFDKFHWKLFETRSILVVLFSKLWNLPQV